MKRANPHKSELSKNDQREGKSIEEEIRQMLNNNEKMKGDIQVIYTQKNEGTLPAYDIRTDRFEIALDGITKIQKSYSARREEKARMEIVKELEDGKPEQIQGTN